jgi:hypothetical protein
MTPTQLRRKLEARLGRPLNVSDARLAELIEEARRRRLPVPADDGPEWPPPRRLPDATPVPLRRGESDARWSNDRLDHPNDRSAAEIATMARHPSAASPTEFETPDLHLVPSEPDDPPTYSRHEEAG